MQELGRSVFETGNPGLVIVLLVLFFAIGFAFLMIPVKGFFLRFWPAFCPKCKKRSLYLKKGWYNANEGFTYRTYIFNCLSHGEFSRMNDY